MIPLVLALLLAQAPTCSSKGQGLQKTAEAQAAAFDLVAAAESFEMAALAGCGEARLPELYLRGWIAAREAYRFGGSMESIAPVERVIDDLHRTFAGDRRAEIVGFVLRAAIAAAQSERDVLGLLLGQAVDLEAQRRAAGLGGAPVITAAEAAGDLWLQVHRYDDARMAYTRAAQAIGTTPRVRLGLARAAVRLADTATACDQYRGLVAVSPPTASNALEIGEARAYLREPQCAARQLR